MKKIISLILAFTILAMMANIGIVSAAIPAGDGNGVKLAFSNLVRTSPGGSPASVSSIEADGFANACKYVYGGGANKTFTKFRMEFTNTENVAADDYLYISFYYRCIGDDTYTLPSYIQRRAKTNDDASSKIALDHGLTTTWQKVSYVTQSAAAVAAGSNVTQLFLLGISEDKATSVEFANPTCVYFGAVTGDNPEDQIMDAIEKAESAPAISVNNGKGASLAFKEIKRNSPSSGTGVPISTIEDSEFGTVTRYEYTLGKSGNVSFSTVFTNSYDVKAGDMFNVSFYYRFTDDETYNLPTSFTKRDGINENNNGKTSFGSNFTAGEWRKASLTLPATVDVASGTDIFLRYVVFLTSGDKICVDIAKPTCIYFGNVASENASEVDVQLNKSDFTSISIGDAAIDLAANPTSYTTTEVVSKSDITAVGYYDSAVVKIASEETDDAVVYTITSYAVGHDLTSTTDTKYTTYTITAVKPAPSITLNGGKGQALEFAEFVGVSPSNPENYSVSELDGTDFEKAYRYEYFGNADLGIIQNIARFKPGTEIPAGEYFYFSYYYRFVKDDTHALPTGIARRGSVNNSSEKPGIETGVKEEWTKAEFIVTNYNAISADAFAETRFLLTLANKTDKIYMDIAEPTCVYFGAATGDVEEAINEQISKSDISAITINGAPVDLAANPTSYTTTEKAEFDNIAVTGYHNPSIIKKSVSKADGNVTYTITAYAVDYDFLDSTDTRKSTYTLTVAAPDYDVYSYDYAKTATGYTVNAMFDNATNEAANFDYIVAAYNGNALVGTGIASYSNVTGNGNELSADIVTESGISYVKIFLWNSKTGLMPVINSRVID